MSLRINNNLSAMAAHRFLSTNDANMSRSIERLSSGLRINSAADDAAGLAISENFRNQISGLAQATRNTQDAVNTIKTAEGALSEIETLVRSMRDLTLHAANANGNQTMLSADQAQFTQALKSINRIADQTEFAGRKLLGTENVSGMKFQVGANATQTATFSLAGVTFGGQTVSGDMHTAQLGLTGATAAVPTLTAGVDAAAAMTGNETVNVVFNKADGTTATIAVNLVTGDDIDAQVTKMNAAFNTASAGLQAYRSDADGTANAAGTRISIKATATAEQTATSKISLYAQSSSETGFGTSQSAAGVSGDIDLTAVGVDFDSILTKLDNAQKKVEGLRVHLGSFQKHNLESNLASLAVTKENFTASESAIRDTDMGAEMVNFTKSQILSQAAQAMMTQANQAPQNIMQMLRG